MNKFKISIWIFASALVGIGMAYSAIIGAEAMYASLLGNPTRISSETTTVSEDGPGQIMHASLSPQMAAKVSITNNAYTIPTEGKAVLADIEAMKLWLYKDGIVIRELPIKSKGRPGTAWETPPGMYEIMTKKTNHLSSIGGVWMPYSMQFFGNFFIHGWPYYPNGTPVDEGFSGGCIRMETEFAKIVYDFVDIKTPVIVTGGNDEISSSGYSLQDPSIRAPYISAGSYLVADLDTGEVILSRETKKVRPIASITKLITAMVSLETINQYQNAVVSASAGAIDMSETKLEIGKQIEIKTLIYPLLLQSSNSASEVLAEHIGRNYFMSSMNKKVKSIGMTSTSFEDPSGLSPRNLSNAEDLFRLSQYLHRYKKYILDVTRRASYETNEFKWLNRSRFKDDGGYLGGKNGFTDEAGQTLIALFKLPLSEFEDKNIAIILLGGGNREEDARALLTYLKDNVYYK